MVLLVGVGSTHRTLGHGLFSFCSFPLFFFLFGSRAKYVGFLYSVEVFRKERTTTYGLDVVKDDVIYR